MKLLLLLALAAGAFGQVHQTSTGPCSVNIANVKEAIVNGDCPTSRAINTPGNISLKPSLSDAQKAALMTAKADQLQAENNAYQAKEQAVQAAMALEKLVTDTLKGIGCEGGQLVRKQGSNDIEVSCPEKK